MQMFEYVTVLTSVIIGLGMTHLLQGVASLIQHPKRFKVYWVHLVWVAFMFLFAIFWWWFEFRMQAIETWTFPLYVFIILYAFLIYLSCALLFPADLAEYGGFREYYYAKRGWFFGLQIAISAADVVDTLTKGGLQAASYTSEYWIQTGVLTALFVAAGIVRNATYHAVLSVLILGYVLSVALRYYDTVMVGAN